MGNTRCRRRCQRWMRFDECMLQDPLALGLALGLGLAAIVVLRARGPPARIRKGMARRGRSGGNKTVFACLSNLLVYMDLICYTSR